MKKVVTKIFAVVVLLLMIGAVLPANAQDTKNDLVDKVGASAMCKDTSGNVYVLRTNSTYAEQTAQTAEIVEYPIAGGGPTVLNSNVGQNQGTDGGYESGTGIAVDGNNNLYITTYINSSTAYGKILKLTKASGYSTIITLYTGNSSVYAYFGGLVIDSHNNLYATAYDWSGNSNAGTFDLLEFPNVGSLNTAFSGSPTVINSQIGDAEQNEYNNLGFAGFYTPFSAITIDASNNIYLAAAYGFQNNASDTPVDGGNLYKFTATGNGTYNTPTVLKANFYGSSLGIDLVSGNLYGVVLTNPNGGSGSGSFVAQLVNYGATSTGSNNASLATGSVIYSPLGNGIEILCWGIAPVSSTDIYVINGQVHNSGIEGDIYELFGVPTTPASSVVFSNTNQNSTTVGWTIGNGSSRAVFMAAASSGTPSPANGTTYAANPNFGSGNQIGSSGWFCIYNGTGTSVNVTGLSAATTYRVMVVDYNGGAGDQNYVTTAITTNPANVTTVAPTITVPGGTTAVPSTIQGTASASANFSISGSGLTAGNLTVTAPSGFQVSPDNSTFTSSYTISESGTLGSTTVYVRTPASDGVGAPSGNVTIAGGGATTASQAVSGTVNASSDATLSNLTLSSGTLNPSFSSGTTSYTASVSNATTSITITPTTNDPNATVTVNGASASTPVSLNVGSNAIPVVVTAQDGSTQITYTVTVTRVSTDATLSALSLSSGTLTPSFSSGTTSYTASVSNATTSITITPITNDPNATVTVNGASASTPVSLNVGSNAIPVVVTAQDGSTQITYTVTVTRVSTDATLSALSLSSGTLTPSFSSGTTSYTASVSNATTSITITPATNDPNATVTVNGASASTPVSLNVGSNAIPVVVTAQDGSTQITYTVTVMRVSTDATLSALSLSSGTLTPSFSSGTTSYTASVSNATTSITITPITNDPNATVTVNGASASTPVSLNVGSNAIPVVVTAQDGSTQITYTVTVTRVSTDATLSALSLSSGTLTPSFSSGTTSYTASVSNATTSITITPTTNDPNATVTVNGASASTPVSLNVGSNAIPVVVTAQDGSTQITYTVTVTRAASNNAYLANIFLSPAASLTVVSGPDYKDYTALEPNTTSSVTITFTTHDPTATVTVNGTTVAAGTPSGPIALSVGPNTITMVSTAQDGTTTKTYGITVTRASSPPASLSALQLSSGTLTPVFATGTTSYTASVPYSASTITVTPTTAVGTATIQVNGTTVASGAASGPIALNVGSNIITTVVTTQDGTTTKTYTVTVTRAAASNNAYVATINLTPAASLTVVSGPDYKDYTASEPNTASSVTVAFTTHDPTATVTVNGTTVAAGTASGPIALSVGPNTITIVSTAQDGTTTKTYGITVTRAYSSLASLSALQLSSGALTPVFASGTTSYTASVLYAASTITVTPTTSVGTATIKVNGTTVASGAASGPIALSVGSNTITTVVTNGASTKTYTVTVTRAAASNNAYLATINLTPAASLTVVSGPDYKDYTASVPNTTSSVTVTFTTHDPTATVKVNGTTVASGTPSGAIALSVGPNTITIVSTAQDGVTAKTYGIAVTRMGPVNIPDATVSVSSPTNSPTLAEEVVVVHAGVSPNGDGINDFFQIDGILAYPDNKLMIMNRNGALVYEAKGYDNSSHVFDGHSNKNGQMQLAGTYFYSLDYTINGITKHKTGFLVLKY